jgi:hypothetical protein
MSAIEPVLDQCIEEMRAGRSLEECLSDYPAQAEELRPYLVMAQQLLEIPGTQSNEAEFIAGRQRMLSRLHHQHTQSVSVVHSIESAASAIRSWIGKGVWKMNFHGRHLITVLLVCWLASIIVVKVSANDLPGSPLYAIKTGWERTRLALTFDQSARTALINQFQEERKREITSLVQLHRSQVVNFTGKLTQLSDHEWVVDGLSVRINAQTAIHGSPIIGNLVTVVIQTAEDGTLLALQVAPLTSPGVTAEPTLRNSMETLGKATQTPIRQTPVSYRKTVAPTRVPNLTAQTPSPTSQHPLPTETHPYPTNTATRVNTSTLPPGVTRTVTRTVSIPTFVVTRNTSIPQPTIALPTISPPSTQPTLSLPPLPNPNSTPPVPLMPPVPTPTR